MHPAHLSLADLLATTMLLDFLVMYRRNIKMIVGMAVDTTIGTKPGKPQICPTIWMQQSRGNVQQVQYPHCEIIERQPHIQL